ncbi:NADH-quinone oxidoreductase subunit NuoK [bacterium]|nr:NADH-quinone oxidoreductase subunit NuoK [bacterium]
MMEIGLTHYLVVSALLFGLGVLALSIRRNAVLMLMGIELILNSANINLVAFSRFKSAALNLDGHVFTLFVIILAAAEAAVALAIVLHIYKTNNTVEADRISSLKE